MNQRVFFIVPVFLLLITQNVKADDLNLKNIRKQLVIAIDNSKTTDSLYKSLTAIKNPTGLVCGYTGALLALKAKHSWNPYFKFKYLNNAETALKTAINADPHNIEIRFLRFSIEHNVPGFLGFNKDLVADREDIIAQLDKKNYGTADKELTVAIIKFLIQSKRCTQAQNDDLNKHLAELK